MFAVQSLEEAYRTPGEEPLKPINSLAIPIELSDFQDVLSADKAGNLPVHTVYDYVIQLEEGRDLPYRPIYPLSQKELEALH